MSHRHHELVLNFITPIARSHTPSDIKIITVWPQSILNSPVIPVTPQLPPFTISYLTMLSSRTSPEMTVIRTALFHFSRQRTNTPIRVWLGMALELSPLQDSCRVMSLLTASSYWSMLRKPCRYGSESRLEQGARRYRCSFLQGLLRTVGIDSTFSSLGAEYFGLAWPAPGTGCGLQRTLAARGSTPGSLAGSAAGASQHGGSGSCLPQCGGTLNEGHLAQGVEGELADGVVLVQGVDGLGGLLFFQVAVVADVAHTGVDYIGLQVGPLSRRSCYYINQMYFYSIPSGIVFGGFMYFLGSMGVLHTPAHHHHHRDDQHKEQPQSGRPQSAEPAAADTIVIKQKELTATTGTVETFTPEAITAPIRSITLNPRCTLLYSTLHKCPLVVHQLLDLATIQGEAERAKHFHPEPSIQPPKFAVSNDHYYKAGAYRNLEMTRGHMAAASDYSSSQGMKNSTFSYANIVPQHRANNSGIWNTFERYTRGLLKSGRCRSVEVISGPIFADNQPVEGLDNIYKNEHLVLLRNGQAIPPKLYKIIKCNTEHEAYASGFVFQNKSTEDNDRTLASFEQPLDQIEDQTGLEFNFKAALKGRLSEYDREGLMRDKLVYDREFYAQLLSYGRSVEEMNSALRRAYEQKISMEEEKEKCVTKVQLLAGNELQAIKSSPASQLSPCRKVTKLLELHKGLFYLGADKYQKEMGQVEAVLEPVVGECVKNGPLEEQESIANRLKYAGKRYRYPLHTLLQESFQPRNKKSAETQPPRSQPDSVEKLQQTAVPVAVQSVDSQQK